MPPASVRTSKISCAIHNSCDLVVEKKLVLNVFHIIVTQNKTWRLSWFEQLQIAWLLKR